MTNASSERRLVENELIFRQQNQRVTAGLDHVTESARSEGRDLLGKNPDTPLHFYCECADENCHERIVLKPSRHKSLHQNNSQFVVLPGHNIPDIERLVKNTPKYLVVEKYVTPPKKATKLHKTDINNT